MGLEGIRVYTLGAYHNRPRAAVISTSGIFPVYLLERRAYSDGIKRKGDKIGMACVIGSRWRW